MKGKKLVRLVGTLCLITAVVLGVFGVLNFREDDSVFSKNEVINTEAKSILEKDMERNYPATVREVVRLYSRILRCFYNEKISEDEFNRLVEMQRKLFDDEFLESNPLDVFTNNLMAEIDAAKSKSYVMSAWRVQKQSSVETWQKDENSFASIKACYTMNEKTVGYTRTYEEFLLRENADGRWKIVGWRLTDPVEIEE